LAARPGGANIATLPSTRPGAGTIQRPASRPSAGTLPSGGSRLAISDPKNFLDLPDFGNANIGNWPSTRPANSTGGLAGGALAGGAAAAFLHDHPTTALPGAGGGLLDGGKFVGVWPARPAADTKPADRPRPGSGERPAAGQRPDARPAIDRPGKDGERPDIGRPGRPGERPARPGDREAIQTLPSRIRDPAKRQQWRQDNSYDIRDFVRTHPGTLRYLFSDGDDWGGIYIDYPYYPGFEYWAPSSWQNITGWVDNGWSNSIHYNYGENVYVQDGSVYYGDAPVATEEEYAMQAEAIATSKPEKKPDAKDWMPLGVFAIASDGEPTGADPTMFLQLAVSKQGLISGTLQNTATNTVQAIEGMVDKQTQRAAFTVVDKVRPLMELGIVNLTKEETPALVHFADGTTQQFLLVRLNKPAGEQKKQEEKTKSAKS
jgi:hypothetical protein